ncbi:MAG: sigma 54-interacting transcriptional regulator [Candidatus Latescibacterota bacterium]|jgi:DNA-binding NtrC family response regulator/ligand-binding sensor domain-containing protein
MDNSSPAPLFPYAQWRQYTVFDGLAGMQVEDLHQDRQGFLWVATADGGVSRFDGVHFDNLTTADGLPHPTVMSIAETSDGRLWFGTLGGGLAAYDGQTFEVLTRQHGLPSDGVLRLAVQADDSLLVLTENGTATVRQGRVAETVTTINGQPLGMVRDAATDGTGRVWLASPGQGVVSLDGRCLLGPAGHRRDEFVWAWTLAVDGAGCLWIAPMYIGTGVHVYRYDPRTEELERIAVEDGAASCESKHGVAHVRIDRQGWVWLTSRGAMAFDGAVWRRLQMPLHSSSLSDTKLTYEDREGNLWVGFWGAGLAFCDPGSISRLTRADGLPDDEVTGLAEDPTGGLWVGTLAGMARLEKEQVTSMTAAGWPVFVAHGLFVDRQGRLWSGSHQGKVYCWDGQTLQTITVGGGEGLTRLPFEDSQGRLWIGQGEGGLGRLEQGEVVPLGGEVIPDVHALCEDRDGRLWIGAHGEEAALCCYDGQEVRRVPLDSEESRYIPALVQTPDGTLWLGTGTGLLAYRDGQWQRFTMADGLASNAVLALRCDRDGGLWIGTAGGGALRYDGTSFQVFRLGDDAAANIVEAVLVDRGGQVWFGTRAGLAQYHPGVTPPGIIIRQVLAGQVHLSPHQVTCTVSVPEVRIAYQGIGFRSGPRQMRYSRRLLGSAAAEWSPFEPATEARYAGLPPGEYRFEVRAMDRDGLCSPPAALSLLVTPDPQADQIEALQTALRVPGQPLIGSSPAMDLLLAHLHQVAGTQLTVLVLGETGTGKGLAARLLHDLSPRRTRTFIHLNCGALPEGIIASELFGHEKGAFTGAVARKLGRFELASGGTLFLDEIGDLPLDSQRVLLQVLESGTLQRLGGQETIRVDVRVVAATNRDLQQAIRQGSFREDLYYRLAAFVLQMPPLRERVEDLPLLVAYFAERFARHLDKPVPTLHPETLARLPRYPWPGNIRELEHLVQRAVLLCVDGVLRPELLPLGGSQHSRADGVTGWSTLADYEEQQREDERQYLRRVLDACNWVIYGEQGAASRLGVHPERLRARLRRLHLQRPPS